LEWGGVKFDEGPTIGGPHEPYQQSKRLDIYSKHADTLLEHGHAYRCFCSSERLALVRLEAQKTGRTASYDRKCSYLSKEESQERVDKGESYVVRMKVPDGKTIVQDEVHGKVEFSNKEVDDSVLMKSDGFPTYHLANVVDDHLMGITHVIRGQVLLRELSVCYASNNWIGSLSLTTILTVSIGMASIRTKARSTLQDVWMGHSKICSCAFAAQP